MQALEELDYLAALDDDGNLSEMGIYCLKSPWTLSWPKHCWYPASLTA